MTSESKQKRSTVTGVTDPHSRPRYYEVFARKDSSDALTHVGSVEAPNDDLAEIRAWYVYDQHRWREMCVVPTDAVVTVRPRAGDVIRIKPV
jgi:1,2-phenylacetyl-CoA epoxidase PaaB subunit